MLSAAFRQSCCLGLLDRPLLLALLVGAVTGEWEHILPLGIVLELFWLDVLPLGSIVPPLHGFAFWLMAPLCLHFQWKTPAPLLLPLLFAVLCAYGGAWLERWMRLYRNTVLGQVHHWAGHVPGVACPPGRAVFCAIRQRLLLQLFFFILSYVTVVEMTVSLQARQLLIQVDALTWPTVYAVAALGAVLSLRARQAYLTLGAVLAALALYSLF